MVGVTEAAGPDELRVITHTEVLVATMIGITELLPLLVGMRFSHRG